MRERYNFGKRHLKYMKKCVRCTMNVAEGAVRAGKTIDHVFVFASLLENSPDRLHLATGATAASAKLIIGECGGFGLERYFAGRCAWGRHRGCDCLRIKCKVGERIVIFTGGAKADSYKKIRGGTFGMWIATEINLHHDSMIKEAFSRQLAAKERRIFWDLNPSSPNAPIYRDYIDLYAGRAERGELPENFFNYGHFTIFDNPNVGERRLREILAQYEEGSVWYRRDILGERCAAEGLVYPMYAECPEKFSVSDTDELMSDIEFINIGVDFGGNRSKTTFSACAFLRRGGICIVSDGVVSGAKGEIDPQRVNLEFERFVLDLRRRFADTELRYAFCDSEAQYLINSLRRHMVSRGESIKIGESAKRRIRDRIDCTLSLMASGKFYVSECCKLTRRGLSEAVWDSSQDCEVRLDNFTSDIDILDAMEYSFERYMHRLM